MISKSYLALSVPRPRLFVTGSMNSAVVVSPTLVEPIPVANVG